MTYLDYASATPVRKEVLQEMQKYHAKFFANPSSIHQAGQTVMQDMGQAKSKLRKILNADNNDQLIFTSGGTESINLALQGVVAASTKKRKHIITTSIEHKAVLETCVFLNDKHNVTISYIKPQANGVINPRDIETAITKDTILISVMYANNEIGTIQPLQQISKIAKKHKITFHTDACQAGSYLDLDVQKIGVDLLTLNSGKIYGPKGVGLLYVKQGVTVQPLLYGGHQQDNLRPGTENVAGIMGFVKALELAQQERIKETKRLTLLRDSFIKDVLKSIPQSRLNGHLTQRLANNINLSFANIEGEALVRYLSQQNIYVSTASACTADSIEVSHVIRELGVPQNYARGTIRITLGRTTTKKELDTVLKKMKGTIHILRRIN